MGFAGFIVYYVIPNLYLYITILIPSIIIGYLLERKIAINIVELLYNWQCVCFISFSIANVIFLNRTIGVSIKCLTSFLFSELIFYCIVLYFQHFFKIRMKYHSLSMRNENKRDDKNLLLYVIVFFILDIFIALLRIKFLGTHNSDKRGGGSGAIIRLQWIITPLSTYSIIYLCFMRNKRKYFLLLFVKAFFILLSNSRSSMLTMFLTVFLFYFLNPNNQNVKRFIKKYMFPLILLSIGGALIIISLMSEDKNIITSILTLLYRFIAYGDMYVWAYPNDTIITLSDSFNVSFFQYLFSDSLSTFRLIPRSIADETNLPGIIVEYLAGPGISEGPNSRFNIVGLGFFGFSGNLFFSVFCASVFIFCHYALVNSVNCSYKKQLYGVIIFSRLGSLQQDVALVPQFITEMIIFLILMWGMNILEISCSPCKYMNSKNNNIITQ